MNSLEEAKDLYDIQLEFYKGNGYRALKSLSPEFQELIVKSGYNLNKKAYYKKVWEITEANKGSVTDIEKREWGKYDLDHIVPISYGFKNKISPELIASPENLRIIKHEENRRKRDFLDEDSKKILKSLVVLKI